MRHIKNYKNYLFILPFVSCLCGYLLVGKLLQPTVFHTPSIIGKNILPAISTLSKHNLNIRIIDYKQDPDLPEGTILSQKPQSGRKIKPHQSVYVVLSKKPYRIPCPLLVGKDISSITQMLTNKNIRNKSYYLPSNHPENHCIAQYPSPSTELKKNNIITYLSQAYKKPVVLPDFRNKKLSKVRNFIKNYKNISVEIINSKNSHICDDNYTVTDQRPLAGSIVNLHREKKLLVHLKVTSQNPASQNHT